VSESYYNTTGATGRLLREYEIKAESQEGRIACYMAERSHRAFTPSEIWRKAFGADSTPPPITSVRRAMTNLAERGVLEKTAHKTRGLYGRAEHRWRLRIQVPEQGSLFA